MPLAALVASSFALYFIWFLVRCYFVRSPLDNIPGPPSASIISGNMLQIFNHNSWKYVDDLIENYGPLARCQGFFGTRMLHVFDPKAMHSVYVKDQDNYYRGEKIRRQVPPTLALLLGPGLLATYGSTHKKQRKMLNPVFSGAHMRDMTPLFYDVAERLRTALESQVEYGPKDLDVLSWMGRTALELLGRGGLGYSFDPLVAESKDVLADTVKGFVPTVGDVVWTQEITPYLSYLGPAWFRRFLLDLVPIPKVQRLKTIVDVMSERLKKIYLAKKAALESGDEALLHALGEGKDVMSVLSSAVRENMTASAEDKLPDDQLLAQMATFLLAGVDTTSNSLARVLHLLSMNPDVQAKLRQELREAQDQYGKEIPYDELFALPYLDAICRETLRLYAPISLNSRLANADTVLPLSQPVRCTDGTVITEVPIQKGTYVILNLRACNINKALWGEDAREWKPERWLAPVPKAVEDARIPGIYSNLTTFLSGGHACIGFKFSQLEMKVVLATLVSRFQFSLSPDKPIFWNFAGITYPVTDHASSKPEMTLHVNLAPC
ncbi:cytochrome P450 [Ganoderma sinense ZZ0214-1]|uniref:Cytochrome P450 n=1 Tax=Ganoderma sinense ZZ0214-1 TaxID=1077348 RepID=A0A2G8SL80_9APHY|nr:cytochrome P450 [Ganoderma sinense ZZ0214-1]